MKIDKKFSYDDIFDLDKTIAKFVLPRLKVYVKLVKKYSTLSTVELKSLDNMLYFFTHYIKDTEMFDFYNPKPKHKLEIRADGSYILKEVKKGKLNKRAYNAHKKRMSAGKTAFESQWTKLWL